MNILRTAFEDGRVVDTVDVAGAPPWCQWSWSHRYVSGFDCFGVSAFDAFLIYIKSVVYFDNSRVYHLLINYNIDRCLIRPSIYGLRSFKVGVNGSSPTHRA